MDEQTRQLTALLATPDVEQVLIALRAGVATVKELEVATTVPEKSVDRHLRALERWGLAERAGRKRAPGRGRPKTMWVIGPADKAQQRFANLADAFALELVEAQAERLRKGIDARRRRDLSGSDQAVA